MKWFRLDADAVNHPKVAGLSDKDFRTWVQLLSIATKFGGKIPPIETTTHQLRGRLDANYSSISRLTTAGLVVKCEDGYRLHDWDDYQAKSYSSAERMRKHRSKSDGTVTPHNTIQHNTTPKIREPKGSLDRPEVDPLFERFWNAYPEKVGKKPARKAFLRVAGKVDEIMAGLDRYKASKPADRAWMHPTTFLNGERWQDEHKSTDKALAVSGGRRDGRWVPGRGMVYPDGSSYSMLYNHHEEHDDEARH